MDTPNPIQADPPMMPPSDSAGQRPLWARPGLLAGLVVIVLVYGSLIPFDFAWSGAVKQAGGTWPALLGVLTSPRWISAGPGQSVLGIPYRASDVLVNVLLYVPLGITLRMSLRQRWPSNTGQLLGAWALAFALSWTVESMQSLMPMRVASLNDVAANGLGALIGGLAAVRLWLVYKRSAFACYCRLVPLISRLHRWRARPGVAMTIALANAVIIGVWYLGELRGAGIGIQGEAALPFERAFNLPYDLGALVLGQALLAYAGIGCLLLLLTYTGARRLAMNWVVLIVVLLAFAAELSRAATHNAMPDLTGPLLALAAAALMSVTVYTLSFAVRRANRRRHDLPFDGPDRRRVSHEYQ